MGNQNQRSRGEDYGDFSYSDGMNGNGCAGGGGGGDAIQNRRSSKLTGLARSFVVMIVVDFNVVVLCVFCYLR